MSENASVDRRKFLGFLGAAAFFLVGCPSQDPVGGGPPPQPPPPPPPPPAPDVVEISMENIAFVGPDGSDDVTIQLGETVRWTNNEPAAPHTATSTNVPDGGDTFDSGNMNPGVTFEFTPNVVGTWVYFCSVHPILMSDARITVEA